MARVTWNSDEWKKEMMRDPSRDHFIGYTDLHLFIGETDLICGAYTPITNFFGFCFAALLTLDPLHFSVKSLHFDTNDAYPNCVSGEGFQCCFSLNTSTDEMTIRYVSAASSNAASITTKGQDFIQGILDSYQRFHKEFIDFYPDMKDIDTVRWLQRDAQLIEEWYRERYHIPKNQRER